MAHWQLEEHHHDDSRGGGRCTGCSRGPEVGEASVTGQVPEAHRAGRAVTSTAAEAADISRLVLNRDIPCARPFVATSDPAGPGPARNCDGFEALEKASIRRSFNDDNHK